MRTRLLLNTLPLLVIAVLALLALALHFNGLYGQDAHEYLRQSHALFGRLCGQSYLPESPGDREFGGGYPLAGAMLQFLGVDSIVALQAISILSAGAVLWLFEQLLRLLAPGANGRSRLLYAGLLLALTPALIRAGLTVMSDALGLALMMAALWQGLRALQDAGVRICDLGQVDGERAAALAHFKLGTGGQAMRLCGTWTPSWL